MTAARTVVTDTPSRRKVKSPVRCTQRRTKDHAVAIRRCMRVRILSRRDKEETGVVFPWRERATARPRRASGGQGESRARCPSPLVSNNPSRVTPRKRCRKRPPRPCKSTQSPGCRLSVVVGSTVTWSSGRRVGHILRPRTCSFSGPSQSSFSTSIQQVFSPFIQTHYTWF